MKKKISLEIKTPCSENFDKMIPNSNGSFCNSCAKNVIDLSTKTNSEVARFIAENKDKSICARLKTSQLEEEFEFNEISKSNNFKYAVAVAASVLLTSNVVGQEKEPVKTEIECVKPNPHIVGKIAYQESKTVSFVLSGKILEKSTKKPLSAKKYPELNIFVSGSNVSVKVNPKTGAYSIPLTLNKNTSEIYVTINSDDSGYSKNMKIDLTKIINNNLTLNLIIDSEKEMHSYKIMGGLGVNYIDNKKLKNLKMKKVLLFFILNSTVFGYGQNEKAAGLKISYQDDISNNDTIIKVEYKKFIEKNNNPAFYINGELMNNRILNTINPNEIDSIKIEKETIEIDNIKYYGKIFIKTKPTYKPKFISLNELKRKYINTKNDSTIFIIDNEFVNADYEKYYVDENFILKIIVEKHENSQEKVNLNFIKLITKTKENIKKSKEIILRGKNELK